MATNNDPLQPPVIGNPGNVRFAILTNEQWMAAYRSLEERAEECRFQSRRLHAPGILLWLKCLTLYNAAFARHYTLPRETKEETDAFELRLDLLGLAGRYSKLALDGLLDGYYLPAYGHIRHLFETWRREVYVALRPRPSEALPLFKLPDESPVLEDWSLRPGRNRGPKTEDIKAAIDDSGNKDLHLTYTVVAAGFTHMNPGSHPSGEGTLQVHGPTVGKRVFGPNFSEEFLIFGFRWGLTANDVLLRRIARIASQGNDWEQSFVALDEQIYSWMEQHGGWEADESDESERSL